MDGRIVAVLAGLLLPAILIGVNAVYYAINPIAMLTLIGVMVGTILYLLSYSNSYGAGQASY
jgi:hypothetical protein